MVATVDMINEMCKHYDQDPIECTCLVLAYIVVRIINSINDSDDDD